MDAGLGTESRRRRVFSCCRAREEGDTQGALPEAARCCGAAVGAGPPGQQRGLLPEPCPKDLHGAFRSRARLRTPSPGSGPCSAPRSRTFLAAPLPGAAARGLPLSLSFRCGCFALLTAALCSFKMEKQQLARPAARAAGMLAPRRARDAGPPATSAPELAPSLRTEAGQAPPRLRRGGQGPSPSLPFLQAGFVQPARRSRS